MNDASAQRGLVLDRVVLLGRTFDEYVRFFGLRSGSGRSAVAGENPAADGRPLRDGLPPGEVLDVAAGVGSFCAEANALGWPVTAVDRIYDQAPERIAAQCEEDLRAVVRDIGRVGTYRWDFYGTPERMGEFRERAWRTFIADYARGCPDRYVHGELPRLPFADGRFALTLVSYLLLVYEDQFSYEFHRDSVLELMRVTRGEVRLYPTVTFAARPSAYLARMRRDPAMRGLLFEEIPTDFEFLKGSNSYLSIRRRGTETP